MRFNFKTTKHPFWWSSREYFRNRKRKLKKSGSPRAYVCWQKGSGRWKPKVELEPKNQKWRRRIIQRSIIYAEAAKGRAASDRLRRFKIKQPILGEPKPSPETQKRMIKDFLSLKKAKKPRLEETSSSPSLECIVSSGLAEQTPKPKLVKKKRISERKAMRNALVSILRRKDSSRST